MQLPAFITTTLGWLAFEFTKLQPFLPTYTHLIISALFPIYAGAHSSLSRPKTAAKPIKSRGKDGKDVDEEEEEPLKMEGLTPTDALLFPVLAGTTLAGLYFLIQWLQDPALLNKILNWYFATFSVFSVARLVSDGLDVFHSILFPHDHLDGGVLFHVDPRKKLAVSTNPDGEYTRTSPLPWIFSRLPLPQLLLDFFWMLHVVPNRKLTFKAFLKGAGSFKLGLGIHGIEGLSIGLATVLYYVFVSKPWWLTNLMGFGFAYSSLQIMSPTTFWTGTLILSGLFFYDIYFVFFTPMMVTVAKSLDIPIKLLFPRPPEPGADPATRALSMLGLGDIVLPGIMIGLALRFDLHMFYLRKQSKVTRSLSDRDESSKTSEPAEVLSSSTRKDEKPTGTLQSVDEQPSTTTASSGKSSMSVVKAPYVSVAEGWGDRLWTSSFTYTQARSYTARGVFPKPYFNASLLGYVTGMVATLAAMQFSNHAQPALLYLVPGVLSSLWGTAYFRGEFQEFWTFSDVAEEEAVEKKDEKSTKAEDNNQDQKVIDEKEDTGILSFFGFMRGEERSQRLSKSISKHVGAASSLSEGSADHEVNAKFRRGDEKKTQEPTLFSFSIDAPPPLFPDVKKSSKNVTSSRSKDVAISSSSSGNSGSSAEEDLVEGANEDTPRWKSGRGIHKGEEHAGKRQRLD